MTPQAATDPTRETPLSEKTRSEVLRLLGYILGRPVGRQETPSRVAEPAWDSLKHIELMFLLEDHFGIRFSETAMAEMEDVEAIVREVTRSLETRHAP